VEIVGGDIKMKRRTKKVLWAGYQKNLPKEMREELRKSRIVVMAPGKTVLKGRKHWFLLRLSNKNEDYHKVKVLPKRAGLNEKIKKFWKQLF